jgi:acetyltransferase-like isoleucine patch superfamily enzyme
MSRLLNYLIEALPVSIARKYSKNWDKSRYDSIFGNKYRLYLPFEGEIEIEPPKGIRDYLLSLGYTITNYKKGLCKKSNSNNEIRIGKVLQKSGNTDMLKLYNNTKELNTDNVLVVISRHPYDIASMSTNRGWTSCMDLIKKDAGKNKIPLEIEAGTIVAYLIRDNDKNINEPIARIAIKPYVDTNTSEVYLVASDRCYVGNIPGFSKTVQKWLDGIQSNKQGVFKIHRDVDTTGFERRTITNIKLVSSMVINDDLDLSFSDITEVPDNITINGNLDLYNSKIRKIGKNLVVKGNCDLSQLPIEELPDNVSIGGSLNLSYSKIRKIGKNLVVNGYCDLRYTPIEELPDNVSIGGNLDLSFSNIKKIGKNLVVKSSCDLSHTPIEELPDNVNVVGNLYLSYSNIKKIGKNLVVNGNCSLSSTPIEEILDNVSIGGNLDLFYSKIRKIGKNLVVKGNCNLRRTPIEELPDNVNIGGNLIISKNQYKTFKKYENKYKIVIL